MTRMAMWKKALVLVVASLVVALPVVTQVAMARPLILGVFPTRQAAEQALGTSSTASQSSVVLPQGKELGEEELKQTDGEFWWIIVPVLWGGALAIYHNWFDGKYGIDRNDLKNIAFGALMGVWGGSGLDSCIAVAAAASAYWNSH